MGTTLWDTVRQMFIECNAGSSRTTVVIIYRIENLLLAATDTTTFAPAYLLPTTNTKDV